MGKQPKDTAGGKRAPPRVATVRPIGPLRGGTADGVRSLMVS